MAREIKFRAWDNEEKKWYAPIHEAYRWNLFELFISFSGDLCAHTMRGMEHQSVLGEGKYTLLQFTGLKDKNGKEIYEGDILNGEGQVRWDNIRATFYVRYPENDFHFPSGPKPERYEVIGNIYENPELLNK